MFRVENAERKFGGRAEALTPRLLQLVWVAQGHRDSLLPRHQLLHFGIRYRFRRKRRHRSLVAHLPHKTPKSPQRDARSTRPDTQTFHAQALQLGDGGNARPGEYIQRTFEIGSQPADGFRVRHTGGEQTISAGLMKCIETLHGAIETRRFVPVLCQEDVRAGVEDDRYTGGVCRCDDLANGLDLLRQGDQLVVDHVFEIHPDRARIDHIERCSNRVVIARFYIRRHRYADCLNDLLDHEQHFVPRDALSIGISEHACDSCAAGGDRRKTFGFNNAGADAVPRVRKNQHFRTGMQTAEESCLFSLGFSLIHGPIMSIRSSVTKLRSLSILVTGAGGHIGTALVRAIACGGPRCIVLLDSSEHNLFEIDRQMNLAFNSVPRAAVLGSVDDRSLLDDVFSRFHPDLVYHAGAFKHVPLLESNPFAAVRNNAIGTWVLAQAAVRHGASRLVLVSTDKAVNPHSIMGASKRIAELAIIAMSTPSCRMNAVRLGNVKGSPGSVVPLFLKQIDDGGPVMVTHPDASRWFMSLDEAVDVILMAGNVSCGGKILLPKLGEPVRIAELARSLIAQREMPIVFGGLRPGDKLTEELISDEETEEGQADGLRVITSRKLACGDLADLMQRLSDCIDHAELVREIRTVVPEYVPSRLLQ